MIRLVLALWLFLAARVVSLWPSLSQKTYPGVGDLDECGMMATVWAAEASDPCLRRLRPSVRRFRAAAGDPDDGIRDGWTLTEIHRAVNIVYPTALNHEVQTRYWPTFRAHLNKAHPVSLAVNSAHLPSRMRYGFYGAHQVGIWKSPKTGYIYLMNPLAPQGSRPQRISEAELRYAAMSIVGASGWIVAECFTPIPVHLHYGGVRTSRLPDRTRATSTANVYSRPDMPTADRVVGTLHDGELFTAYQHAPGPSGRTYYGDHRGTKWVNAARLAHKGGST